MSSFLTLHDPARTKEYYGANLWRGDTFYNLLAKYAETKGEAMALRDSRVSLTWSELKLWVDGVAADLSAKGLTSGDRVSIWMSNRVEAVITFLSCSRQGYACNPSLHRTFTSAEVIELLDRLKTSAFVTEPGWGGDTNAVNLDAQLNNVKSLKVAYSPETFPGSGTQPNDPPQTNPDKISYLAFTSGTTGEPKCVMHSDNTLLANARDLAKDWNLGGNDRILTLSPLSHHIAWVAAAQWLVSGSQLIVDDPFEGMSRIDWITETKATYVLGVPTHAMDILAEKKARGAGKLGDVSVFYMAGAPIPPSVAQGFVDLGIKPQNVYGMTENSSHQYTHPDDDLDIFVSTCGRGGAAYEVRIFDADDCERELPAGEVGQIGGRGAALMLGYYGNQAATEASFNRDGWFLSGDLGSIDDKGNLKIEGRLKDLIIRGGHNIYPAEIEALALRHSEVEKVAVFPIPDERLGEKICIALIGSLKPEPLLEHLALEGLSKYDMPEKFVRVDEFPLTASGKILKRELVEMAKRGEFQMLSIRFNTAKAAPS